MDCDLRGENSRGDGRVNYVEGIANVLRRITVEDCSKLILDRSMESFADGVGLGIPDSNRHWLDPVTYESSLKSRSSKLASLILDDLSRSRIPREPAVSNRIAICFSCTIINSRNFPKASADIDDGQCSDDKFSASNIDLPGAN
jgi:hypothetical protein